MFLFVKTSSDYYLCLAAFFEMVCKFVVWSSLRLRKPDRWNPLVLDEPYVISVSEAPFGDSMSNAFVLPGSMPRYPFKDCWGGGSVWLSSLTGNGTSSNVTAPFLRFIWLCKSECWWIRYSKSDICASSQLHREAIPARSRFQRHAARFALKIIENILSKLKSHFE